MLDYCASTSYIAGVRLSDMLSTPFTRNAFREFKFDVLFESLGKLKYRRQLNTPSAGSDYKPLRSNYFWIK